MRNFHHRYSPRSAGLPLSPLPPSPTVLFMWCILPGYGAAGYVPSIVLERTLYTRERSDGLYLPLTYLLAKARMTGTTAPAPPYTGPPFDGWMRGSA